jgi:hypothetical protein
MIELLLKASFAIGIAFLFYKLLLQQESFFATNRLYLVGCIAMAFVLPFINLPPLVSQQGYLSTMFEQLDTSGTGAVTADVSEPAPTAAADSRDIVIQHQPSQATPEMVGEPEEATETTAGAAGEDSWVFWLSMLYVFGVSVFSLSLLFQIGNIFYKIITATDKIRDGDCVIVCTSSRQAPCSFFQYIFIRPDDYDYDTYEQIIAHEKIHARQGHSLDLIIAELAVIVLWFNPFIWLMRKEIEKNNEYQTDAILLEQEQVSPNQYQLNLLQIAVPNKPLSITTNYNQSLLKQRIMMMNAKKSTPHAYWKYSFLAPLFFGTLLLLNEPASSQNNLYTSFISTPDAYSMAGDEKQDRQVKKEQVESKIKEVTSEKVNEKVQPSKKVGYSVNINGKQTDMSQGYWYSHREGGEYCIEFKGNKGSSNWNMSRCFDSGQFQKKGNDVFVITKETGTLQLTGNLDAEVSQGKYTFTEDAAFKKYLAGQNITSDEKNLMFHLFFGDMNRQYVDYLKKQYGEVEGERLLELAIHGIKMQDYQNYMALFQKYGNKKPSIEEVVGARIHGIDKAYVQEVEAMGFKGLALEKMMEAKIHGVDASYVKGLKSAGFDNLTMDKIIEAKIHGLKPGSIKEMQSLGFGNLSLDKMLELKIHGVNAAYIADLKSAGLGELSIDRYVEAKIHGLNSASVKEIRALGYKDLDIDDMMSAQIHGVDAAYVEDLKKAGFTNLSMDKTVEAKIHGIDSNFIKQAREKGYNLKSIDKYIELKIHGMALESLKE